MSYDLDTQLSLCDHQVLSERYLIGGDFQTLCLQSDPSIFMRAPLNSQASFKMYIGGQVVSSNHPTYGYTLVRDFSRDVYEPGHIFYKVVFNKRIRLAGLAIELAYLTRQSYCMKCLGSGKTNDFKKANSGSLLHIVGNRKLVQKCLKWILTSRCSFYPNFTCPIKDYVGRKLGSSLTEADMSQAVNTTMQNMKRVQNAQAKVQTLTPSEVLKGVSSVSVNADTANPTLVRVSISVEANQGVITDPINFSLRAVN